MKISFMTFSCPGRELEEIPRFARRAGYDGVEMRVDAGHKHGISSQSSYRDRLNAKKLFQREGIEIAAIATSIRFAYTDPVKRLEVLKKAKENIILASHLEAKIVRIFAGDQDSHEVTPEIARILGDCFSEAGDFAEKLDVIPVLETGHDIMKGKEEALAVIEHIRTSNFGILWNNADMTSDFFNALKDDMKHFHIHHNDVYGEQSDKIRILASFMKQVDYNGYISLEIISEKGMEDHELIKIANTWNQQISEG
ncbi:MAG TPA: hypothetical protein DD727_09955 [Clostridiales bacterium]|nr:hypothetical protein [Clostridiales bacterium]